MLAVLQNDMAPLFVVIIVNILLGLYRRIGVEQIQFDWRVLLTGVLKAAIVAVSLIALTYVFDTTGLGGDFVTPHDIMVAATVLYMGKSVDNLVGIFGVTISARSTSCKS